MFIDQSFFSHSVNCSDRVSVKIDHGSVNRPPIPASTQSFEFLKFEVYMIVLLTIPHNEPQRRAILHLKSQKRTTLNSGKDYCQQEATNHCVLTTINALSLMNCFSLLLIFANIRPGGEFSREHNGIEGLQKSETASFDSGNFHVIVWIIPPVSIPGKPCLFICIFVSYSSQFTFTLVLYY